MWERHAALTLPGIILLVMCLILIGGMFVGFNYSRAAGFFTMAVFGAALLALVAYLAAGRSMSPKSNVTLKLPHYRSLADRTGRGHGSRGTRRRTAA